MTIDRRVESGRQALRLAFGIVPLLAGLDKFFNLLTDWPRYLSPAAQAILPVSAATFMHVAGVVEMLVGIAILTRWTTATYFDIAVRDLVMAIAAYTLARLTEAHETAHAAASIEVEDGRGHVGRVA